jgi:hypothetical protein
MRKNKVCKIAIYAYVGENAHIKRLMPHSGKKEECWKTNCTLSVRHAPLSSEFSLRFTFELDTVGIVIKAVKDSICQSGVWDTQMPIGNRDLAGDKLWRTPLVIL